MLAVTYSVALIGVQAEVITIEVNSGERGELRYILVGLLDSAVKESQVNKPANTQKAYVNTVKKPEPNKANALHKYAFQIMPHLPFQK